MIRMIDLFLDGQFAKRIGPNLTSKLYFLPKHILECLLLEYVQIEGCGLTLDSEGITNKLARIESSQIR